MFKILISGYYGFNNAGDDSVLYGIISSLHKKDPTICIGVLSNDPEKTENMFHVPAFNRWNLLEVTKRIRDYDLLLMGGGSLLQDATSPRSVLYYLGLAFVAKIFRKPVVFYAQGIGPINKRISKRLIQFIVNKVDVITVRDFESCIDLKQFGVKKEITVTADPAITIQPNTIDLNIGKELLKELNLEGENTLAISVRSWKKEKYYLKQIAFVADHYADKGWDILFLALHHPDDIIACQQIMQQMKNNSYIIKRQLNFKEIMSVIGNVRFVIGMRLHSIIFSAVMNTPFIGISYDPKIDRFVKRMDMYLAGHINNLKIKEIIKYIDITLKNEKEMKKTISKNMEEVFIEADYCSQLTLELAKKDV